MPMAPHLAIEPLGPCIGGVIRDIDLNSLDSSLCQSIREALATHLVLFFLDQQLSPAQLRDVAANFGTPTPYPYVPGIEGLPEVVEVIKEPFERTNFGGVWHSDTAYLKSPAMGALLYAVEIPVSGGDTIFTNMYEVLASLSPGMQAFLAPLRAVNDADKPAIRATRPGQPVKSLMAEHPVIRIHPDTGRPLLYVNRAHTTRFAGMSTAESEPILEMLFDRIEQPEFSCRFSWRTGSVAFWDNRACQHYPLNDYHGQRRRMLRVSIAGDRPIGPAGRQGTQD